VLPHRGAKLLERVPLHRWQRLRPDARTVSHLFVISRLVSAGREPRRKPERFQTRREFRISVEMVAEEEEEEGGGGTRTGVSSWQQVDLERAREG
jgi:hypothetical protein